MDERVLHAFLADCKDNPADLAPRLILADWLEDHGQHDRGRLIRLQCDLLTRSVRDPERRALTNAAQELGNRHLRHWRGSLDSYCGDHSGYVWAECGLLVASFSPRRLATLEFAPDDGTWPWVEALRIESEYSPSLLPVLPPEIWHRPFLNHVARVEPGYNIDKLGTWLPGMLTAPCLDGLRCLDLHGPDFTPEGYVRVIDWHRLGQLRDLSLAKLPLGEPGLIERLPRAPRLGPLQRLILASTQLTGTGWRELARCPRLDQLRILDLRENNLTGADLEALATAPLSRSVRELILTLNRGLGDRGALALAGAEMPALRSLRLGACRIESAGASAMACASWLPHIERLELDMNDLRAGGADLLAGLRDIEVLRLDHCNLLGKSCCLALANNPHLGRLRHLDLRVSALGPDLASALASNSTLGNLRELELDHTRLGDRGLQRLAEWPGLAHLYYLGLQDNELHDESVAALLESPYLRPQTRLDLMNNPLSEGVLKRVQQHAQGASR
jgi:uncharacterized protein (TIGR02996 family)